LAMGLAANLARPRGLAREPAADDGGLYGVTEADPVAFTRLVGPPDQRQDSTVLAPASRLRRWPWRASLAVRCARRSWKRQVGTKRWSRRSNKEVIKRKNAMRQF